MPFVVPQQNQGFGAQPPPVPQGVRQNLQPQRQQEPEQQQSRIGDYRQQNNQQQSRIGDYRQYAQPQQRQRPQPQQRQRDYSYYGGYGRGQQPYRQPQPRQQQQWDIAPKPQVQPQYDEMPQLQPQLEVAGMQPLLKNQMQQYRVPQQQVGMPPIMPTTRYGGQLDDDGMVDAYNKRGY